MTTQHTPYKLRHLWGVRPGDSPFDADIDATAVAFINEPTRIGPLRRKANLHYEELRLASLELGQRRNDYLDGYACARAEDAPLLEAAKALADDVDSYGLAHPDGGRFEADALDALRTAIEAVEGRTA